MPGPAEPLGMRRLVVLLCLLLALPAAGWADHPREVAGSCAGVGPDERSCVTTFVALREIDEARVTQDWLVGVLRASISDGERRIDIRCDATPFTSGCGMSFPGENLRAGAQITITVDAVGVGGWRVDAMYADV
jgi:hypothetical protein